MVAMARREGDRNQMILRGKQRKREMGRHRDARGEKRADIKRGKEDTWKKTDDDNEGRGRKEMNDEQGVREAEAAKDCFGHMQL